MEKKPFVSYLYLYLYLYFFLLAIFPLCSLLLPTSASAKDVCAVVKIEILQEMTFERQAFEARMKITNGLEGSALENVRIDIYLNDEAGDEKTNLFFITLTSKTGLSGEPDGSGRISSGGSAEIYWLLIPAKEAAGDTPFGKRYFAGATLGYTVMGEQRTINVDPDMIQVLPQPYLKLDYFLPGQVYGDDPFTEETESAISFNLGVRIHNIGLGPANKLKIDSGQPRIVQNELGLLIDFKIIGSSVNDQPATNSLLVSFGDLESRHCGLGRWQMISTLTGNFIEFEATLTHADYLGGEMTSLVDYNIGTHFLLHDVLIDLPGCDQIRDFLTRDFHLYPSEPYYDQNSQEIIHRAEDLSSSFTSTGSVGANDLCLEMIGSAFVPNPYLYLKKEELTQGVLQITRVLRSDGKSLPPDNYWVDSESPDNGHTWRYFLHIFDTSVNPIQDVAYCLFYESVVDTTPPSTSVIIGQPQAGKNPVYVSRDTQFTFLADDASESGSSGIKGIRFSLDAEEEGPCPNPFMFSQRLDLGGGSHLIHYYSIDNMGNREQTKTLNTVLDLTAPLIGPTLISPQIIKPGAPPDIAVEREAGISLTVTDDSGKIEVQLDFAQGGNFQNPVRQIRESFSSGSKTIIFNGKDNNQTVLPPGEYQVRIRACDPLGNVSVQEGSSVTITSYLGEGPVPEEDILTRMRLSQVSPTEASNPKDQINPAIDHNGTIVWQDFRNGNWDIYKCAGSRVVRVTIDPSAQENPAVYGDTIVWQDYRSGDWDIYYQIGSNPEVGLIRPGDQINPHISGNRLVFEEDGNIFLHTIGGETRQITSHIRDQILPGIDGNIIVWQDSRFGDPLIYAYDIAKAQEIQITPIDEQNHTRHITPWVSGDSIVWADNRAGHYDIYHYRISDGSTQRLTYGLADQMSPYVFGDHFMYADQAGENSDLAFGSVLSLISERVIIDPSAQKNPRFAGSGPYQIVWQDNRRGYWAIYRGLLDQTGLTIPIYEGLNLISLPREKLPLSQMAADLYTILHDEYGVMRLGQWNMEEDGYSFIDQTGGEFTLNPQSAFTLYGRRKSLISIPVVEDQGAMNLKAGFNQIGLVSIPAGFTAYDLIESLGGLKVKMVQKFSGRDQRFLTINMTDEGLPVGSNFPIYAGDGLTIIMNRPVSGWRPGRL